MLVGFRRRAIKQAALAAFTDLDAGLGGAGREVTSSPLLSWHELGGGPRRPGSNHSALPDPWAPKGRRSRAGSNRQEPPLSMSMSAPNLSLVAPSATGGTFLPHIDDRLKPRPLAVKIGGGSTVRGVVL